MSYCKKTFNRKNNLERHLKKHNSENNQQCPDCLKVFTREAALDEHLHQEHGWPSVKRSHVNQEGGISSKKQKLEKTDDPSNFDSIEKVSENKIKKNYC